MSLSIQRLDDFVEAHEIADEWQILAIACLIRVCECSSNDVAKFANVAHVKATHIGIKRKSPAHGSVCLFLRSEKAHKILVVARRDDERMIREPGVLRLPAALLRRSRRLIFYCWMTCLFLVVPRYCRPSAGTRCCQRPAKAERTLRNTTIHSTVTTRAKGRPLGSINM